MLKTTLGLLLVLALAGSAIADTNAPGASETWMAAVERAANNPKADAGEPAAEGDGPPLPLHTIEGVGGALTVPMAYLVNPGPKGTVFGKPAVSFTFLRVGDKDLEVWAITETILRRIELGYAFSRFGLGNLTDAVVKVSGGALKINRHEVYLHHFNIRGLLVEENTEFCGIPMPAIVAGVQAKLNGGIMSIDAATGGAFTSLGLEDRCGVDFTLHASKMFPTLAFGRPVIVTVGGRSSKASNIGLTGFGEDCLTTVEADVACLVTDKIAVGYEFRQKNNPFGRAPGLLEDEDDWHAVRAAYIVNDRLTIAGGWAYLGPVGNHFGSCAWGIQIKYEF